MVPQSQPQTQRVRVNGTDLAYIEQGAGDGVVFVHGSLGDYRSWMAQMEPFARRYRAVAYSRRFHYPNDLDSTTAEYLMTNHRDDLAALIQTLGLAPVHVVASSYGAYTSLLLARTHPELVRSLVLGEPPAAPLLGPDGIRMIGGFLQPAHEEFERGNVEQAVRSFIDSVMGKGRFDQLSPPARQSMLDNAPGFKMEVSIPPERYFPPFGCDDAFAIKVPTLLLTGELSPKFFHQITDELERCMPNTQRDMIPRASHGMHNANPSAYNETVLAFLAKH